MYHATTLVTYSVNINGTIEYRHLSTTNQFRTAARARAWMTRQAAKDIKLEVERRAAAEGELVAIGQPSVFMED